MKLFKKAKKGFTLVELVVVIAVIAILSAVSVGAYFGITTSANQSACEQEAKAFHTNLVLVANNPKNTYCSLSAAGLEMKAKSETESYSVAELVTAIETEQNLSYTENYTINIVDGNDTDSILDTLTFAHKTNGAKVALNVVTGETVDFPTSA